MLRIAIQAKGRLNEKTMALLADAGISASVGSRSLIAHAKGFPVDLLLLRDDDIPQAVAMGTADIGIVGFNEVSEKDVEVEKVLDLGCGSGILGIGALLLGCAHVTGCDIDPKAPEVAAGNAALNGFYDDRFTVCAGDILADAGLRRHLGTGYDLVLANIVSDVIIPLAAHAPAFLAPGGTFICSGIIDGREDEVRAAIERAGFTVTAHDSLEEWHCFTATLA